MEKQIKNSKGITAIWMASIVVLIIILFVLIIALVVGGREYQYIGNFKKIEKKAEKKETSEEKEEYLLFKKGGVKFSPGGEVIEVTPQSLYLISKDRKEKKLIQFEPWESIMYFWRKEPQIIGNKMYYSLGRFYAEISKETVQEEIRGQEIIKPVAVINSKGESWSLDFLTLPKEIAQNPAFFYFRVSPDEKKIAWLYDFYSKDKEQLWIADINGDNKEMMWEHIREKKSLFLDSLRWSKHFPFIYLFFTGKGALNLSKFSLETKEIKDILTGNESFVDISPDENLIAYLELDEKYGEFGNSPEVPLVIKNIITGEKVFITKTPKERSPQKEYSEEIIDPESVKFAPNGKFLIYAIVGYHLEDYVGYVKWCKIFLIDIEKKEENIILTNIPKLCCPVDWLNEKELVLYCQENKEILGGTYIININGSDFKKIAGEEYEYIGKMELSKTEVPTFSTF